MGSRYRFGWRRFGISFNSQWNQLFLYESFLSWAERTYILMDQVWCSKRRWDFFLSQQPNKAILDSQTGIHSTQEWPLPIAYTGLRWRKGCAPVENNCHNDSLVKIWSLIVESTFLLGISPARHGLHVFQNQLSFFCSNPSLLDRYIHRRAVERWEWFKPFSQSCSYCVSTPLDPTSKS